MSKRHRVQADKPASPVAAPAGDDDAPAAPASPAAPGVPAPCVTIAAAAATARALYDSVCDDASLDHHYVRMALDDTWCASVERVGRHGNRSVMVRTVRDHMYLGGNIITERRIGGGSDCTNGMLVRGPTYSVLRWLEVLAPTMRFCATVLSTALEQPRSAAAAVSSVSAAEAGSSSAKARADDGDAEGDAEGDADEDDDDESTSCLFCDQKFDVEVLCSSCEGCEECCACDAEGSDTEDGDGGEERPRATAPREGGARVKGKAAPKHGVRVKVTPKEAPVPPRVPAAAAEPAGGAPETKKKRKAAAAESDSD